MKTTIKNRLSAILAITVASGLLFSLPLNAQVHTRGSAKGGATKLMRDYASKKLRTESVTNTQLMSCEKCKDIVVTVRDRKFKGAGSKPAVLRSGPTKKVLRHLCEDCSTQWKVTGHGKNKVSVAKHECAKCL